MNKKIWAILSLCFLSKLSVMAEQQTTSIDQLVLQKIQTLCPSDQLQTKTLEELGQLSQFLRTAETFLDGATQKSDVSVLRKKCDLQLTTKNVLSNINGDTIADFTVKAVSNQDYNDPAFGSIFQTVYQICSNKLLGDLTALLQQKPITLTSLTTSQNPNTLMAILGMLNATKGKNFLNFGGNITVGTQSFNPGDENSPNSAKNAISNLIVNTNILIALAETSNPAKLSDLKTLADSVNSIVSTNAISDVTKIIYATAVMSAAKAATVASTDSNLNALLTSATTNKLLSDALKKTVLAQLTAGGTVTGTTTAAKGGATTARGRTTTAKTTGSTTAKGGTTTAKTTGATTAKTTGTTVSKTSTTRATGTTSTKTTATTTTATKGRGR